MSRVISLVPSWTETLIEAGIPVVGRTRFCIHPSPSVAKIPVVGGTKEVDWSKTDDLSPDYVIMDREENTREMAESCPWQVIDTHVQSMVDVAPALRGLSEALGAPALQQMAQQWQRLKPLSTTEPSMLPGVLEWLEKPQGEIHKIVYLIWRDPWMAASRQTFIGSVFHHLGYAEIFHQTPEKYPKIDLDTISGDQTLLLFSSEPYPFHRRKKELMKIRGPKAIVDGECFSWFGVRAWRFLESVGQ